MLRLGLAAVFVIGTSSLGFSQTLPPNGAPVPPVPASATAPIAPATAPLVPVRARNAPRTVSPGFHAATPIIDGNPHIRVNRVGQVLTDELP